MYNEGRVIYLSTVRCTNNEFASNRQYCLWQGSWFWVRPASKLWKADVKEGYIDRGVSITMDCRKKALLNCVFPCLSKQIWSFWKWWHGLIFGFLAFDPLPSLGQRASKNVLLPDVDHPHLPQLDCGHMPRWNFQQIAFRLIGLEGFCLHGECLSGRQKLL